ncbi:MFS transporter [Streptomyces erythrochromogenes]|uniref:MFS transporter n=1 Tax=Streptomyces erythrochromogenes TaxID=285574 RepID=UPI003693F1B0
MVLITFTGAMDSTILATALPTIARELGDLQHLSWVVTAYLVTVTSSALIWGKLGDLFGHKRVLQLALIIFLVGSVLCGHADSMPALIAYRGLQGVGGGGILVVPQAILTGLVGPRDRGRSQVFVAGAGAAASILGPLLGGLLVEHGSWRWAFYLNVPVVLTVMAALAVCLRHRRIPRRPRIDYWGSLLIAVCAAALTLLVTWGGVVFAWFSPPMLLLLALVAVLAVLIWRIERSHPEPLMPARVVRERVFRVAVPLSFFFWVVQSGTVNYLPLFFQVVKGSSPTTSGMLLLPMSLSGLLAYTISGQLISRWPHYRPYPIIGALLIIAGLGLCVALHKDASPLAYGAALVVLGLGFGLVSQIALIAAQSACAYQDVGIVTSGVIFFRNMGSAFGAALFGAVLNRRIVDHMHQGIAAGEFTAGEVALIHKGEPLSVSTLTTSGAQRTYISGYEAAVDEMFLAGLAVSLLVLALACALPSVPLRQTMTTIGARKDSQAIPSLPAGDPHVHGALEELGRGLLHPVRHRAEEQARRYGVSLDEIWLLCVIAYSGAIDVTHITEVMDISRRALRTCLRSLRDKELLSPEPDGAGPTPQGSALVAELSRTLHAQLAPPASAGPSHPNLVDLNPHTGEILAEGSAFRKNRQHEP